MQTWLGVTRTDWVQKLNILTSWTLVSLLFERDDKARSPAEQWMLPTEDKRNCNHMSGSGAWVNTSEFNFRSGTRIGIVGVLPNERVILMSTNQNSFNRAPSPMSNCAPSEQDLAISGLFKSSARRNSGQLATIPRCKPNREMSSEPSSGGRNWSQAAKRANRRPNPYAAPIKCSEPKVACKTNWPSGCTFQLELRVRVGQQSLMCVRVYIGARAGRTGWAIY